MLFGADIFICGCVGAAAPEIVRLYKLRHRPFTFPKSYFLISIFFFLLGGFVAVILPAITLWGAFYCGITLPSLISTFIGKPPRYIEELAEGAPSRLAPTDWREYLGVLHA